MAPKFLIIQTAFPGDAVLATALAESLHAAYPSAQIHFLLRKGTEGLLAGHPFISQVWVWNKGHNKYKNIWLLLRAIRKEGYSHVVCVQRFLAAGLLAGFSGAPHRLGFRKNPAHYLFTAALPHIISGPGQPAPVHEVARNHNLIARIPGVQPALPRLYPTPADCRAVAAFQEAGPYICIAPASVWPTKQFPGERWASLTRNLPEDHQVYLIGGPADRALAESILREAGRGNVENLCGKLSFLQSAALMAGAAMNYTNDSAPLHIAGAVGAPLTAVFCSTVPRFGFAPLGEDARVAEHPGPLYCRPCGLHGRKQCPEGHFRCALDIKEEDLLWWTR